MVNNSLLLIGFMGELLLLFFSVQVIATRQRKQHGSASNILLIGWI